MRREATRVLVTGGAGFIGSHLVRALVDMGHSVRVLDDLSTGARDRLAGLAVELLQADVRNPAAVRRACEGAEVVFHLASMKPSANEKAHPDDVRRAEEVNVGGALNLFHACLETRPQRIVLGSSGCVYGRVQAYLLHEEIHPVPATAEAVQKLAAEQYARVYHDAYRLPVVTLRIFNTYGPGERWDSASVGLVPSLIRAALEGRSPLIHGDGRQTRDLVYVDNVVAALLGAGGTPGIEGQLLNIAAGESIGVAQLWGVIGNLTGNGKGACEPTWAPPVAWEPNHLRVSVAAAARSLGYANAVRLRDGLARTVKHYAQLVDASDNGWFAPHAVGPLPIGETRGEGSGAWPKPARAVPPPPMPMRARSVTPPPPPPAHLRTPSSPPPARVASGMTPLPARTSTAPRPAPAVHEAASSNPFAHLAPSASTTSTSHGGPLPGPRGASSSHPTSFAAAARSSSDSSVEIDADDVLEADEELDIDWAPVPGPLVRSAG